MFVDAANRQLKTRNPEPYYRTMAVTNIFIGLFFAPIPVYFLVDYFGWETAYMVDPDRVTRFFTPIVLVAVTLAANLGFWLSNALIQRRHDRVGRMIYVLIWIYALVWILGNWPRSTRIGTYTQYHTARETMARAWDVSQDPFLIVLMGSLVMFLVPFVLFVRSLRRWGVREAAPLRS
jgi:hypothetical protein